MWGTGWAGRVTAEPHGSPGGLGPLGRRLLAAFAAVAVASIGLVTVAAFVGTSRGLEQATAESRDQVLARVTRAVTDAYVEAGGWDQADLRPAVAIATAAGARLVVVDSAGTVVLGQDGQGRPAGGSGRSIRRVDPPGPAGSGGPGGSGGSGGSGGRVAPTRSPTPSRSGAGSTAAPSTSAPRPPARTPAPAPAPTAVVPVVPSGPAVGRPVSGPVVVEGETIGTVRLLFGTSASSSARSVAWWWIALAAALALVLALVAGWWVTRRLARPLTSVAATARAFAGGDRTARTGGAGPGEIGDVARALDEMADEVVRSEQGRRQMASDVAHELRTPLAALQAGLEEVRDGLVDADAAVLAGLHDQSLRLARLVDDLAALSTAEAGGAVLLSPQVVDLAEVVRSETAAHEARLRAAEVAVVVRTAGPVTVEADPDRLRQVVANLLSNAARYCRAGDQVEVRVATTGDAAVLTVADTGPGIPRDEIPHVFDRLWRGRAGGDVRGSGIGLAVVRELVTAHGGTVRAESDGRSGTTFRVELPVARPAAAGTPRP